MSDPGQSEFQYLVSAKGALMVISLIGPMNGKFITALEGLQCELDGNSTATIFIFNFRDVSSVSGEAVPFLANMQKSIRARNGEVRLCGIKPNLKIRLLAQGMIRTSELFDNLQVAIQTPTKAISKKAV